MVCCTKRRWCYSPDGKRGGCNGTLGMLHLARTLRWLYLIIVAFNRYTPPPCTTLNATDTLDRLNRITRHWFVFSFLLITHFTYRLSNGRVIMHSNLFDSNFINSNFIWISISIYTVYRLFFSFIFTVICWSIVQRFSNQFYANSRSKERNI